MYGSGEKERGREEDGGWKWAPFRGADAERTQGMELRVHGLPPLRGHRKKGYRLGVRRGNLWFGGQYERQHTPSIPKWRRSDAREGEVRLPTAIVRIDQGTASATPLGACRRLMAFIQSNLQRCGYPASLHCSQARGLYTLSGCLTQL